MLFGKAFSFHLLRSVHAYYFSDYIKINGCSKNLLYYVMYTVLCCAEWIAETVYGIEMHFHNAKNTHKIRNWIRDKEFELELSREKYLLIPIFGVIFRVTSLIVSLCGVAYQIVYLKLSYPYLLQSCIFWVHLNLETSSFEKLMPKLQLHKSNLLSSCCCLSLFRSLFPSKKKLWNENIEMTSCCEQNGRYNVNNVLAKKFVSRMGSSHTQQQQQRVNEEEYIWQK